MSAPVFREVAQEVLEYLGVPHDQPVKTPQQMLEAEKNAGADDVPDEQVGDLNALFDEVNSLPPDDPLRQPANAAAMAENAQADAAKEVAAANAQLHRSVVWIDVGRDEGSGCVPREWLIRSPCDAGWYFECSEDSGPQVWPTVQQTGGGAGKDGAAALRCRSFSWR